MKLPRLFFVGVFIFVAAAIFSRTAAAQAAFCDDINTQCKSYHYAIPEDGSGHKCEFSGLTLQCWDYDVKICDYVAGGVTTSCIAETSQGSGIADTRKVSGIFQIADFVKQFVRLSQWGLGFVVVLAVLMFIWGGWQFLTAAGRSNMVEDGKKIIGGTITGLIISFAAYIIINFTVVTLTGASVKTSDIFAGPIGLLFPKQTITIDGKTVPIQQPFSGSSQVETRSSSDPRSSQNSDWNKDCTDHIYCADTGTGPNGPIWTMQKKLGAKQCSCGTINGVYGASTVDCVRRFQLANNLPASGIFDATTSSRLESATSATCPSKTFNDAGAVMSLLPAATLPDPGTISASDTVGNGCCVVPDTDGQDAYCLPGVSTLVCSSLAKGATTGNFYPGSACEGSQTANRCGFCYAKETGYLAVQGGTKAFQYATPNWCANHAVDNNNERLEFHVSTCDPWYGTRCIDTLGIYLPK